MGDLIGIGKPKTTAETVAEVMNRRQSILEQFTQAYVAETGLMPSQINLVERRTQEGFEWRFEPTHPAQKSVYEMNLEDEIETLRQCLNSFRKESCWCNFKPGVIISHTNQCKAIQKAMGMKP